MSYQEFELYNKFEEKHWWFTGRREILKTFLKEIGPINKKKILEVGFGSGGNLAYLFNDFNERVGIDYSPDALNFAQKKLGVKARLSLGDCNKLDKITEKFEAIAFMDVLYHQKVLDVKKVLDQASELLNEGGHLIITDGAFDILAGKHGNSVESARRFTKSQLQELLNEKYEIIKISYWGLLLFALMFIKRVVIDGLNPKNGKEDEKLETDLFSVPILDQILYFSLYIESLILNYIDLPFGASIAIVARKKSKK